MTTIGHHMSDENIEYLVTQRLPDNGQRVMCFGHKTYCCKEDMQEIPDWYEVVFCFTIGSYKIKNIVPVDPEESILQNYTCIESWELGPEFMDGHVIGVTKWKKI